MTHCLFLLVVFTLSSVSTGVSIFFVGRAIKFSMRRVHPWGRFWVIFLPICLVVSATIMAISGLLGSQECEL